MEKEIRKRASVYGVVAVLLVAALGALCYNYGVIPGARSTLGPSPSPSPSPSLSSSLKFLSAFSSNDELRNYLVTNLGTQGTFPFYSPWDVHVLQDEVQSLGVSAPTPSLKLYSTTNIQVAGVDEADVVKTDGEYIYYLSANRVLIVKAYPPEQAEILSNITFNDSYPAEIFASGNRLIVLGSRYGASQMYPMYGYSQSFTVDIKTYVDIYDISDRTHPALIENFTMSGSYFNSRMIGDYVYFVISQPAYVIFDTVILPKIYSSTGFREIPASEIHYSNMSDNYYQYTTIAAMNVQNVSENPTYTTLLLGGTSSMYVSLNNIYITFPNVTNTTETAIYRIHIENSTINCEAEGKVHGRELNQFSMDEDNDYFRIATSSWMSWNPQTNLYILDMNLSIVGTLEGIAPNETMDSARFMRNRCYLSTSVVKRDPFFVIDVENASEPRILGYLKIPGFTRYLHPYDEDHVIGVGRDGNNVKITLFDVSNVSAPTNMSEYAVQGYYSDTTVLSDYKAFLFEKSKDLLVIPLSITLDYYEALWQGVYVFNVTLNEGIALKGNITHCEGNMTSPYVKIIEPLPSQRAPVAWYITSYVKRALYIEDTLYTVSDVRIKMHRLEDLSFINEIVIP